MKQVLLIADLSGNNGPANVCKYLKAHSGDIDFFDSKKKTISNIVTGIKKIIFSKVVIVGTSSRINYILFRLSKLLGKKTIFIMHGYNGFESRINSPNKYKKTCNRETKILNLVDLILPVSERYKEFFLGLRPEYDSKTHYLTNGIDKFSVAKGGIRNPRRVIVCGANRRMKRNSVVCEAINHLNRHNPNSYFLDIYGLMYEDNEELDQNDNIRVHGRISHDDLLTQMSEAGLFVLNTRTESFGLSVIDALACGCNVLVSKNAGVCSILKLKDNDIINDCNDSEEIARKIKYNTEHSNNKRIIESIDFEHYSWGNVARRLERISECVKNGDSMKEIRKII